MSARIETCYAAGRLQDAGPCQCVDVCAYGPGNPVSLAVRMMAADSAARRTIATDSAARKEAPVFSGVMKYFPKALAAVARLSKIGNDKHNPGEALHWSRGKSDDHGDCIARHQLEAGTIDTDGRLHDEKVAWRALAQLEIAIEKLHADGVDY